MIIVRVELHSAITGKKTEIARMLIDNIGGTRNRGHYRCRSLRGRSAMALDQREVQRAGEVTDYPRLDLHVWNLVARALGSLGYGGRG
jgi:hypothetical protein